jgi:hypothetical protein
LVEFLDNSTTNTVDTTTESAVLLLNEISFKKEPYLLIEWMDKNGVLLPLKMKYFQFFVDLLKDTYYDIKNL